MLGLCSAFVALVLSSSPASADQNSAPPGAPPAQSSGGKGGGPVASSNSSSAPHVASPAPGRVSNVYQDADARTIVNESAAATGNTIVVDDSVKLANVTIEFKDETIEGVLGKLALYGGFFWKKKGDAYLVTSGLPDAPLFREFAQTRRYAAQNLSVDSIAGLLPEFDKPYVAYDKSSNVVMITAPEALIPAVLADIRRVDGAAKQIIVEAMVTEVTYVGTEDFGFSWNWRNFSVDGNLALTYTRALSSDVLRLKALITSGKATLRANPRLATFEGRPAELSVGQETYYSLLSGNATFPTAQVQLIKTGVTLHVTGFIGDDGEITLKLDPEVSDAVQQVNGNPTTNVRRASTNVRVPAGETIAIGGLMQDTTSESTSRVPVLGQIPVVGGLFKQKSSYKRRTETVILITPRISDDGIGEPKNPDLRDTAATKNDDHAKQEKPETQAPDSAKISLNNATLKELESLPGVGRVKAKAILDYREAHKGFRNVEEVQDVKGIGPMTYAKIKNLVRL